MALRSAAEITARLESGAKLLTRIRLRAEQERETRVLADAEPSPLRLDVALANLRGQPGR